MGFSSLATYVILFTVGLSVVSGFVLTFRDFFSKSSLSLEERQEISRNKMMSDIEIKNYSYSSLERNMTWKEKNDFNIGIYENTTSADINGKEMIELSFDNNTGYWISNIIELSENSELKTIESTGTISVPTESSIEIRIRTANNLSSLTGSFLGPDGTENTFYALNEKRQIFENQISDSVIQIKANFSRRNPGIESPRLDFIIIEYEYSDVLNLVITNTGKIRLDDEIIDLFLDGNRIPRTEVIEKNVLYNTNVSRVLNPGIWEPGRDLSISVSQIIESGTRSLTAINQYSTKSTKKITI